MRVKELEAELEKTKLDLGAHMAILGGVKADLSHEENALRAIIQQAQQGLRPPPEACSTDWNSALEGLRSRVEELERERDEARSNAKQWESTANEFSRQADRIEEQRDAALARVQALEGALSEAAEWISEGVPGQRVMGWNNSADLDEKFSAKLRALAAHPETEKEPK